jgi:hypothetical protein
MGMALLFLLSYAIAIAAAPPKPVYSVIKPPVLLTVTLPKNGDFWAVGENEGVYWDYNPIAGKFVDIWLLKGSTPVQKIVSHLDIENTVHHWRVPESVVPGSDYRILIASVEKPAIKAYSSGYFTIRKIPTGITVMVPNGGQTWIRATKQTIGWMYTGEPGTTVKITLMKGDVAVREIAQNYSIYQQIEHMGSYLWTIPGDITPDSGYKIKVQVTNTSYMDSSDQTFTIK